MRYLFIVFAMLAGNCFSQEVEHNYEMAPQITTCDSLELDGLPLEEQLQKIEKTVFRSVENFKLNRREGFQGAWFYSCDNKNGILIAKINNEKEVFSGVTKKLWNELIASGDFENYIRKNFTKH